MTFEAGTQLDQYRLVEKIGEGGMGVVWKARDTSLDRDVAIKVLPESLASDEQFLARFEREAKAVATLSHPNIVGIHGFGRAQGQAYAVMELLEGQTLRDLVAAGPLPSRKAVGIARQVAEGLDAAHGKGIVHRDLKPENVFVTADGRARILDFGLATALPDNESEDATSLSTAFMTAPGTVMGTIGYMSPEQVRAEQADSRSDIFSLGTMLWEMLAGAAPFARPTQPETMTAILREDPPEITQGDRRVPPVLDRILRRCLEKSPGERFQNARDLAFALEIATTDSITSGSSVELAQSPLTRRFRGARGWTIALLAAGALFVTGWLARRPLAVEVPRVTQLTFSGADRQPDASPDGRLIAFTSARLGISQIWLRQIDGGVERQLTEGADFRPRFSPDGTKVAFIRRTADMYSAFRIPALGGEPRRLMDDVTEIAWSPDGTRLAFIRGAGQESGSELGVLDLDSGDSKILVDTDEFQIVGVDWSPDGRRLVTTKTAIVGAAGSLSHLIVDSESGASDEIPSSNSSASGWAGSDALIFARAQTAAIASPRPDPIVRLDLGSRRERVLLWAPYLFPRRRSSAVTTKISLLGEDRLLFDSFRELSTINEFERSDATRSVLAEGLSLNRQPAYSPDGSRVLFTSDRSGNKDLFSLDISSGRLAQLTEHSAADWDGAYTPDGRSILWSSDRSGNYEIWIASADGAGPRQVSRDGVDAQNPTMTPDGEWVVFTSSRAEQSGIYKVRPDGTDSALVVPGNLSNAEVSPDGRYVSYVELYPGRPYSEVRVAELDTGRVLEFTIKLEYEPQSPNVTYGRNRWLPDGEAIAFVGLNESGHSRVFIQDFVPGEDTTDSRRRLGAITDDTDIESFGISPDGDRFAISTLREVSVINLAEGLGKLR